MNCALLPSCRKASCRCRQTVSMPLHCLHCRLQVAACNMHCLSNMRSHRWACFKLTHAQRRLTDKLCVGFCAAWCCQCILRSHTALAQRRYFLPGELPCHDWPNLQVKNPLLACAPVGNYHAVGKMLLSADASILLLKSYPYYIVHTCMTVTLYYCDPL